MDRWPKQYQQSAFTVCRCRMTLAPPFQWYCHREISCFLVCLPAVWFCFYTDVTPKLHITLQVTAVTWLSALLSLSYEQTDGFLWCLLRDLHYSISLSDASILRPRPLGKITVNLLAVLKSISGVYMIAGVQDKLGRRRSDNCWGWKLNLSAIIQFHGSKFVWIWFIYRRWKTTGRNEIDGKKERKK